MVAARAAVVWGADLAAGLGAVGLGAEVMAAWMVAVEEKVAEATVAAVVEQGA